MDVSENNRTPKSSILMGIFHYKPSILGYPYFWKLPYVQILSTERYFPPKWPRSFVNHSLIFFSRKVLNIVVAENFYCHTSLPESNTMAHNRLSTGDASNDKGWYTSAGGIHPIPTAKKQTG